MRLVCLVARSYQGPVGQGKAFGVVEVDISKGGFVCGCELFFPEEEGSGSFSFLWQVADALVSARCCRLGHTQLLPSTVMEKGSGYVGQCGRQVIGGKSWEETGWWLWHVPVASWVPPAPRWCIPEGL